MRLEIPHVEERPVEEAPGFKPRPWTNRKLLALRLRVLANAILPNRQV